MAGPKTPPSMPRCPLCRPTWWWTPEVSIGEKWWKIMENRVKMLIHIHSYQIHIHSFSDLGSSVDLSEWSNFIQFTQLFPLPGAAETEGTGKSWGPSRQLAMPRILPKMEMSQVHFSVQEHLFWSKEIRISFHGGSSNPKRKPSLLQNHGFCARIGITLPQNGSNTAFYLGKMRFLCFRPWGQPKRVFRISIKKCIRSQNLRSDFPINKKAYMIYYDLICIHMHPFCMEELSPLLPLSMPCPAPWSHLKDRHLDTFFRLIRSSVVLSSFSCICCKVLDTSSIQPWFKGRGMSWQIHGVIQPKLGNSTSNGVWSELRTGKHGQFTEQDRKCNS